MKDRGEDLTRFASARELLALATEFRDRAQAAEAELLAAFSARAAAFAPDVAPLLLDDDDDERLELRADGSLAGAVLDEETYAWVTIETPEDIVLYYDPTDVFLDLAAELIQEYPDLAADETGGADALAGPPTDVAESATLVMLKDLVRSGAMSEADFERLREQMHL